MARGKKAEEQKEKKERVTIDVSKDNMTLSAYWVNPDEESSLVARCDLIVAGAVIIKVSLMFSDKKSKSFISFPQYKSKDDTYYNYALPASKESAAIISELADMLMDQIEEQQ